MAKPLVCHTCGFEPASGAHALHCPKDGSRLVPVEEHEKVPHDPYLGRTLGERYALVGLLGEGAMGAVYLARQMPLDREVAVKVIRPMALTGGSKGREQLAQRFLREAQLQADFNHHAVVTVLDFGAEPDGTLFMVMERLHGRPLSDVLAEGVTSRVLAGMILQLLDALGRFHDRGLIHRDIKPDNLMVLEGPPNTEGMPRVKLLDFGIAKSIRDGASIKLTQDGTVFGTPEYMAPEQAMGVPESVDHRADLYAVGAVLYEGLAGRPPFTGGNPLAILHRVVSGQVPPLPDDVEPALRDVVFQALAKDRDRRFADARAMGQALAMAAGLVRDRPTMNPTAPPLELHATEPEPPPTMEMSATAPPQERPSSGPHAPPATASAPPRDRPSVSRPPIAVAASAPPLGVPADPRDAFSLESPGEPDSAELVLKRRAPWRLILGLAALGGLGTGAWLFLDRPPPEPVRPVSTEPVRVQVNARFDTDAGAGQAAPSSAPR